MLSIVATCPIGLPQAVAHAHLMAWRTRKAEPVIDQLVDGHYQQLAITVPGDSLKDLPDQRVTFDLLRYVRGDGDDVSFMVARHGVPLWTGTRQDWPKNLLAFEIDVEDLLDPDTEDSSGQPVETTPAPPVSAGALTFDETPTSLEQPHVQAFSTWSLRQGFRSKECPFEAQGRTLVGPDWTAELQAAPTAVCTAGPVTWALAGVTLYRLASSNGRPETSWRVGPKCNWILPMPVIGMVGVLSFDEKLQVFRMGGGLVSTSNFVRGSDAWSADVGPYGLILSSNGNYAIIHATGQTSWDMVPMHPDAGKWYGLAERDGGLGLKVNRFDSIPAFIDEGRLSWAVPTKAPVEELEV